MITAMDAATFIQIDTTVGPRTWQSKLGDGVVEQGDGAAFAFGEKFVRLNTFRIYLTVNRL